MSTQIIKWAAGTIGVGGAVIGSYYGYQALNPSQGAKQNTEKKTTNFKKTILNNESNVGLWQIKLSTYKRLFKAGKQVTLESEDEAGLKKWCLTADKTGLDSITQQLCNKPNNSEKLLQEGKKLAVEGDWNEIADKYKREATDNEIKEITNKNEITGNQIKEWCEKTLDEEILEVDTTYKLTLKWCTKEGK